MILDATCQLDYECATSISAVFMLRPRSGWAQWIMKESFHLHPRVPVVEFDDLYGNLCQRLVMPKGRLHLAVEYRADVADGVDVDLMAPILPVEQLPTEVMHYLLPSRYCPSDQLGKLALQVAGNSPRTYLRAARIRTWIHRNVTYQHGSSHSSTSALDTAQSRVGVCRDFAHLGISLCRAMNIPARMVVGFLHELQPMDLHAWFEAYLGGRWFTFDATEDVTKGNRIVVAYGRDAADVALATLFGPFKLKAMRVTVGEVLRH